MLTQSGALGLAILDYAKRLGIGISSFVSVGNKADVSGNDLIQVLGRGSSDLGHPALPRELRQPEEVQRDRPPGGENEANHRGQGGTLDRRLACRRVAHRRADLQRYRRRCFVPAGRCHQNGASRGAVRCRGAAVASAGPARRAGGDPDQRRRAGHPGRRCLRGQRPRAANAQRRHAIRAALISARGCERRQSRGHVGISAARPLSPCARSDLARRVRRQRHHHFHSASCHRTWRSCDGYRRRRARRKRQTGSWRIHAGGGRTCSPGAHSFVRLSRIGRVGARAGHQIRSMAGEACPVTAGADEFRSRKGPRHCRRRVASWRRLGDR